MKRVLMCSVALAGLMAAGEASACSAVIVGKKASATGRVIVAHNADGSLDILLRYAFVPAHDGNLGFFWSESKNPQGGFTPGDTLLNECGVIVTSNNGGWQKQWCGRTGSLPDEGDYSTLANGGVGYELRRTIGERAHTAREGLDIATNLLATCGYVQDSRNFIIADKDEAWILEVVRGRRYVARRCPDDEVVAYPNCMTITTVDAGDAVSGNIAAKGEGFNFIDCYQGPRTWKSPYNYYRMKHLYRIVCGRDLDRERTCPFSMKPCEPVTAETVKRALSSHYEGTEDAVFPQHPLKAQETAEAVRVPICRYGTRESYVCTLADKASDIVLELAGGRPCELPYAHYRPFVGVLPPNAVRGDEALRRMRGRDQPVAKPARVGIFTGSGPRSNGFMEYLRLLNDSPDFELTLLDAGDIRGGALANVDLLVIPGGKSMTEKRDLGPEGAARIKDFLWAGGGYVGSCAGCCLLMDDKMSSERGIGIIPYYRTGSRGAYMMPVTVNAAGAKALGLKEGSYEVRYNGGPVLEPSTNSIDGAKFEIWATYDHDFEKPGTKPEMVGRGAMVGGTFGKGRVFAFTVHPENFACTRDLLRGAFRYVLGRDVAFPERQRKVGSLVVGWFSDAVAGKEPAQTMLSVDAMLDVDLFPISKFEIIRGLLDHVDLLVLPDGDAETYAKKVTPEMEALLAAFQSRGGRIVGWGEGAKACHGLARDLKSSANVLGEIFTAADTSL